MQATKVSEEEKNALIGQVWVQNWTRKCQHIEMSVTEQLRLQAKQKHDVQSTVVTSWTNCYTQNQAK